LFKVESALNSERTDEVIYYIKDMGERMLLNGLGYIQLFEYNDIFSFIEAQDVESWCSESLKKKIKSFNNIHSSLISDISQEWCE